MSFLVQTIHKTRLIIYLLLIKKKKKKIQTFCPTLMYHKMSSIVMIMEVTLLYFINSSYRMMSSKLVFEVSYRVGPTDTLVVSM